VSTTARRRRPSLRAPLDGLGEGRLLSRPLSTRDVVYALLGLWILSSLVRTALVSQVQGPTVFSDELGYARLAQSIGETGRPALFDNPGLSYSPMYPVVLSPIYALGASAPTAYTAMKILNAFLISLAVFPVYGIARFVLSRRLALLVAGLSLVAPLMTYVSFTMSENLAYPMCLLAIWAMLESVCRPGAVRDGALLVAIGLATAARVQLIVLVPVALTAMVAFPLVAPEAAGRRRTLLSHVRRHWLLLGALIAGVLLAGAASVAGVDVSAIAGRYAVVGRAGVPDIWHLIDLFVRHLAGIDLAVGIVPFVAAVAVADVFRRSGRRPEVVAFAAVAVSTTAWFLLEVAWEAAQFDSPTRDVPRVHERFLIYVVPFFLVALVAASRLAASKPLQRSLLLGAAIAVLLPVVIPYKSMINNTISVDTFALGPFARPGKTQLVPVPYVTLIVVGLAATLSLLYMRVRPRLRTVVLLVLLPFFAISSVARLRIESGGAYARSVLPKRHADWVDQKNLHGDVILLTAAANSVSALQTAYENLSIKRLYYLCRPAFGPDFGEDKVTIDPAGRLLEGSSVVRAPYAVVPGKLGVRGRVVSRNRRGRELLVAPLHGRLTVRLSRRHVDCSVPQRLSSTQTRS
jgi:hypothetical protein